MKSIGSWARSGILAFVLVAVMLPASSFAQDFTLCDGLRGAAFGLCRAGVAVGCDVDDTQSSCDQIAAQFEQITGEQPPWAEVATIEPNSGGQNTIFTITYAPGGMQITDLVIFYLLGTDPADGTIVDVLTVSADGTELTGTFSGVVNPGGATFGVRVESSDGMQRFSDLRFTITGPSCPPNCGR